LNDRLEKPVGFLRGWLAKLKRLTSDRKFIRYALYTLNIILVIGVGLFVLKGEPESIYHNTSSTAEGVSVPLDPLDQLSSADVAANLARMANMPETIAIKNQADSANAELLVPPTDAVAIAKPQTIATALKSRRDIKVYTAKAGDTIASIAAQFGVTSDSILWSNGLSGNSVDAGKTLNIPPVNGLVLAIKAGDTADTLASKYSANKEQIVIDNDIEVSGLYIGELVLIRGGQQPAPVYSAWSYGTSSTAGFTPTYGFNGYDYGYCTWYAASKVGVPGNWGNANTWDNLAPLSGWAVSSAPKVGAVAQSDRGYFGHVAVVEAVSADGSQIKYSDMNGLAGYGRVGYSEWVSASHFGHYIYR
jgi:surface antigen